MPSWCSIKDLFQNYNKKKKKSYQHRIFECTPISKLEAEIVVPIVCSFVYEAGP